MRPVDRDGYALIPACGCHHLGDECPVHGGPVAVADGTEVDRADPWGGDGDA